MLENISEHQFLGPVCIFGGIPVVIGTAIPAINFVVDKLNSLEISGYTLANEAASAVIFLAVAAGAFSWLKGDGFGANG